MRTGIIILSIMAAIWAALGVQAAHFALWTYVAAVLIALVPLFLTRTRRFPGRSKEEARRIGRLIGMATSVEVVAIIAGIQLLVHAGQDDFVVCLVAAVVGLHFIPLARWMPMPIYYLSACALVAAACIGLLLPTAYRDAFVAAAAALALWGTALAVVLKVTPAAARVE